MVCKGQYLEKYIDWIKIKKKLTVIINLYKCVNSVYWYK